MAGVWYNDNDPFVCAWLENLIAAGLLPTGRVDCRPIEEVKPEDVEGFTQCHFFAGIGGWPYALQLAGWGDRPVWTGSCPCQPFSAAGKRKAEDDPRHLWPQWFRLIRECRPERILGEQVANGVGKGWLDVVATDLEAQSYTFGSVVLGAHSIGAPHRRQRIWFVADAKCGGREESGLPVRPEGQEQAAPLIGRPRKSTQRSTVSVADPSGERLAVGIEGPLGQATGYSESERFRRTRGQGWTPEPNVGRVANGIPNRVGKLRGFGNAIVPQVAAAFIQAYQECMRATPEGATDP